MDISTLRRLVLPAIVLVVLAGLPSAQSLVTVGGLSGDRAFGVAVDASGNSVVAGTFDTVPSGPTDFDPGAGDQTRIGAGFGSMFVARYTGAGTFVSVATAGNGSQSFGNAVAIDPITDDAVVVGTFRGTVDFGGGPVTSTPPAGSLTAYDAYVARYAPDGTFVSLVTFGGGLNDEALGVAVDATGNTVVTGRFAGMANFDLAGLGATRTSAGDDDIFVARYAPDGTFISVGQAGSGGTDAGNAVVVAADGTAIVAGEQGQNIFVGQFDALGLLTSSFQVGAGGTNAGRGVALDASGDIVVSGLFSGTADFGGGTSATSAGGTDGFVARYSRANALLSLATLGGPAGNDPSGTSDAAFAVAVDDQDRAVVTGRFGLTSSFDATTTRTATPPPPGGTNPSPPDVFTARYAADGSLVDVATSGGSLFDVGFGVAIAPTGFPIVVGQFTGTATFDLVSTTEMRTSNGNSDFFVLRTGPVVNPPPTFSKEFSPSAIATGGTSTLTFTIDNTSSTEDVTGLTFRDDLPAGVVVAASPMASATCTSGTLTADAGTGFVSYSGGTAALGTSCTISVDVTSDTEGTYTNLSGDLTSSLGNSGTATADLTVALAASIVGYDLIVDTESDDSPNATSLADCTDGALDGDCSLREAIAVANANDGTNGTLDLDQIGFEIRELHGASPDGSVRIRPGSALPSITDSGVSVDGYSQTSDGGTTAASENTLQSGSDAVLLVEVDGSRLRFNADGLVLEGANVTVRGLVVNRFRGDGIEVASTANQAVLEGNYLGTNVAGDNTSPNRGNGVNVVGASGVRIGSDTSDINNPDLGARNLISGNGSNGVSVSGSGAIEGLIAGNYIGTNAAGDDLGNAAAGIYIEDASDIVIGGVIDSWGNTIAFNDTGVLIVPDASGIAVIGNSLGDNVELGLDLSRATTADGVTGNDIGDDDDGPNGLQNFPVITTAVFGGQVGFTLNSEASTTYRVEAFASAIPDGSGFGEGARFLGFVEVTTDANGNVSGAVTTTSLGFEEWATLTATPIGGISPSGFGGTSEFSEAVQAIEVDIALTVTEAEISESAGTSDIVATVEGGAPGNIAITLAFDGADGEFTVTDDDATTPGVQLVIEDGETTGSVTLTAIDDTDDAPDETVTVTIASIEGNGRDDVPEESVEISITDDDPTLVALSVSPSTVSEDAGDGTQGSATLTATLTSPASGEVLVTLTSDFPDDVTIEDDADGTANQITIPDGETTGTATLTAVDDTFTEADEIVTVSITAVDGDGLGPAAADSDNDSVVVTVTDDTDVEVTFTVVQQAVLEDAGSVDLEVVFSDSPASEGSFTVTLTSGDPVDLGGFTSETITVGPQSPSRFVVSIPITDDARPEDTETFIFALTLAGGEDEATSGEFTVSPLAQTALVVVDNDGTPVTVVVDVAPGPFAFAIPVAGLMLTDLEAALPTGAEVYVYDAETNSYVTPADGTVLTKGQAVIVVSTGGAVELTGSTGPEVVTFAADATGNGDRALVPVGNPLGAPISLSAFEVEGGTLADVALVFDGGAFRPVSLAGLEGATSGATAAAVLESVLSARGVVVLEVVPDGDDPVTVSFDTTTDRETPTGVALEDAAFIAIDGESAAVLEVASADGAVFDQLALRFGVGTDALDAFDGLDVTTPVGPTMAAFGWSETGAMENLFAALSGYDLEGGPVTVPLVVAVPEAGNYVLSLVRPVADVGPRSVIVEVFDGTTATVLEDGATLAFTVGDGADLTGRFAVRVSLGTAVANEEAALEGAQLSVWPNPSTGHATVVLASNSESVRVSVYDALGREVAVLHDGASTGELRLAVEGLAPGAYVLRASSADGVETRPFTVVR